MNVSLGAILTRLMPLAMILWILLEGFNTFLGPSSHRVLSERSETIEALRTEVAGLEAQERRLIRRADMLNPKTLDEELLDEVARSVLGYAHPDDVVIPADQYRAAVRKSAEWADGASAGGR